MYAYLIHRVMTKKPFNEEVLLQWLGQGTEGRGKGKFDEEMQKIVINKGLVNGH